MRRYWKQLENDRWDYCPPVFGSPRGSSPYIVLKSALWNDEDIKPSSYRILGFTAMYDTLEKAQIRVELMHQEDELQYLDHRRFELSALIKDHIDRTTRRVNQGQDISEELFCLTSLLDVLEMSISHLASERSEIIK